MIGSFVAVGDSFTEGMQDDLGPDGRYVGWADRVAAALALRNGGLRYANLAVRGRLLHQVVTEQVPVAVGLAPDLVSFHAGANDLLRPGVDPARLLERYRRAVQELVDAVPGRVLIFTYLGRIGATGRTADAVRARITRFNDTARDVGATTGAIVVDLGAHQALGDARLWHADRLHLGPPGHARVAAAVLEALAVDDEDLLGGAAGWWQAPLAAARPRPRPVELAADVRWAGQYLLPWIGRRLRGVSSGDSIRPKHTAFRDVAP